MTHQPSGITLGPPTGHRVLGSRLRLLVHSRSVAVIGVASMIMLLMTAVSLATGPYPVSPGMLIEVLRGRNEGLASFFVLEQRLPRAVGALLIGGALGLSGALFQSVSRNPLGSPDIVGFTRGATTGGLVMIIALGSTSALASGGGAILGGALVACIVILLTLRHGAGGDALVLTGIALGQTLASLNDYLLTATTVESAEAAKTWQHGSLNGVTWQTVMPLALAAALLLPMVFWLARPAQLLELGDDAAAGLGLRVRRVRATMIGYGVVLAAVCVAAAGPIGFLALAAPQLARRLCHSAGITPIPSVAVGAVLLLLADFTAGRLLSPFQLPVGLVSSAFGGLYLLWLLNRTDRRPGA